MRSLAVNLNLNANRDLVVPVQYTYLDIFGARLDNLEQTFDCQFDRLIPRHVILMVFLQELSNSLG